MATPPDAGDIVKRSYNAHSSMIVKLKDNNEYKAFVVIFQGGISVKDVMDCIGSECDTEEKFLEKYKTSFKKTKFASGLPTEEEVDLLLQKARALAFAIVVYTLAKSLTSLKDAQILLILEGVADVYNQQSLVDIMHSISFEKLTEVFLYYIKKNKQNEIKSTVNIDDALKKYISTLYPTA